MSEHEQFPGWTHDQVISRDVAEGMTPGKEAVSPAFKEAKRLGEMGDARIDNTGGKSKTNEYDLEAWRVGSRAIEQDQAVEAEATREGASQYVEKYRTNPAELSNLSPWQQGFLQQLEELQLSIEAMEGSRSAGDQKQVKELKNARRDLIESVPVEYLGEAEEVRKMVGVLMGSAKERVQRHEIKEASLEADFEAQQLNDSIIAAEDQK
jgi:hypothetical protein